MCSRHITPAWALRPTWEVGSLFRWGKFRTPIHTVTAWLSLFPASSASTTLSPYLSPGTRPSIVGATLGITFCATKRVILVYHVPHAPQIDRVRTPLYAEWDYRCVGSPSILTDLPTVAILALGPNGGSSPAAFTTCNAEDSHRLSIPTILRGSPNAPLVQITFTECLRPRRYRRRTLDSGTGDTTP